MKKSSYFLLVFVFSVLSMGFSGKRETHSGFFIDEDKAFEEAKRLKQPLLISFFGIWCPPCNELEETVYESRKFLEKAQKFVLLRIDADAPGSWKIKHKYKVGGYPTIVFADPAGEEVYRVVGYRKADVFVNIMDLVLRNPEGVGAACRKSDVQSLRRCALICSERDEGDCAKAAYTKLLHLVKEGSADYLQAKTYFAEHAENEDLKKLAYTQLMKKYPDRPQALLWAYWYSQQGTRQKLKEGMVKKILSHSSEFSKSEELSEIGLTPTDVPQIEAELYAWLGDNNAAKTKWIAAAEELEKLAKALGESSARGFTLERISCLAAADRTDEALSLSADYREKYPKEFTFHYQTASILFRKNRYKEALGPAEQAYKSSYGDNRIRSAIVLIKILGSLADVNGAKKVYEEVKQQIQPDQKLEVRTHRYLKALDKAWEALPKTVIKSS